MNIHHSKWLLHVLECVVFLFVALPVNPIATNLDMVDQDVVVNAYSDGTNNDHNGNTYLLLNNSKSSNSYLINSLSISDNTNEGSLSAILNIALFFILLSICTISIEIISFYCNMFAKPVFHPPEYFMA
ncbi:MAG: hypothetical protein ACP5JP_08240 [bacterium]